MKRKTIAVMMGLVIALTPALAGAESTQTETEKTQETVQTPPEKPDGENARPGDGQAPPEKPDGENGGPGDGQAPPEMPDGEMGGPGENGGPGGQGGPGMGGASGVESYDAVNEYTESTALAGQEITSAGTDENAVLVSGTGAEVTVEASKITRTSDDSTGGDNASFYGVGAAMLVTDGTLTVDGCTIDTDAAGGAGVFAYGDGTAYVYDTEITTTQGTSGGIHVAGGGTLYAENVTAVTNGGSAAAIRSDRGGGTMNVTGGSFTSNGDGSPAVYCTADIHVEGAELEATGSEAVCIEGRNSLKLKDCDLTGNMPDQDQNDNTWNVIVYQSMSGDSEEGNGIFEMSGGSLTAYNGGMFYTTNTESTITLQDVEITNAPDAPFFLQVTGNTNARGWGSEGKNGADCVFTAISQQMEGDVIWDSISTLDFYLTGESTLTGAFVNDETWAGEGGDGYASLTVEEGSSWIVTGDSTLTSLHNAGTLTDSEGNAVTVALTDGTVVSEGSSAFTVTVSEYSEEADVSGASAVSL